jgi:solute carrier family 25 S-adenosylmethionine transporter 26
MRRASAGAIAGALANGLLHPLDTVKTVRQTSPVTFTGTFSTMSTIWQKSGPRGLYGGFGTAMIGAMPSSFVFFGTYEFVKRRLHRRFADCSLEARARIHMCAAASGNAASSLIFVPKEMIKQRLQASRVRGLSMGVRQVVRSALAENGVRGLYAAYTATIMRNIPTTALNYFIYEELRLRLGVSNETAAIRVRSMLCGAISGATSSVVMTPLDVVKTRLATGRYAASLGLRGSLVKLATEEGLIGLFAGAKARIVGAAIFSAIGLSTYEACKYLLKCDDYAGDAGNGAANAPAKQPQQRDAKSSEAARAEAKRAMTASRSA